MMPFKIEINPNPANSETSQSIYYRGNVITGRVKLHDYTRCTPLGVNLQLCGFSRVNTYCPFSRSTERLIENDAISAVIQFPRPGIWVNFELALPSTSNEADGSESSGTLPERQLLQSPSMPKIFSQFGRVSGQVEYCVEVTKILTNDHSPAQKYLGINRSKAVTIGLKSVETLYPKVTIQSNILCKLDKKHLRRLKFRNRNRSSSPDEDIPLIFYSETQLRYEMEHTLVCFPPFQNPYSMGTLYFPSRLFRRGTTQLTCVRV